MVVTQNIQVYTTSTVIAFLNKYLQILARFEIKCNQKQSHIIFNKTKTKVHLCWGVLNVWLRSYEICSFILVGHYTMESILFQWCLNYTWTNYCSIFMYVTGKMINCQKYWNSSIENNSVLGVALVRLLFVIDIDIIHSSKLQLFFLRI